MKISFLSKSLNFDLGNKNTTALSIAEDIKAALSQEVNGLDPYNRLYSINKLKNHVKEGLFFNSVKKAKEDFSSKGIESYSRSDLINSVRDNFYDFVLEDEVFHLYYSEYDYLYDNLGSVTGLADKISLGLSGYSEELSLVGISNKDIVDHLTLDDHDLEDSIRSFLLNEIRKNDSSNFNDFINEIGPISLVHTPNSWGKDTQLEVDGNPSARNVIPNESFLAFLRLINVTPGDFAYTIKKHDGYDVLSSDEVANFHYSDWVKLCSKDPYSELGIKLSMKPALEGDDLLTPFLADSSNLSPTLLVSISAEDVLNIDQSKDMVITGGKIGLHDFIKDTGTLVSFSNPVLVSGNLDNWSSTYGDESFGSSIDSFYINARNIPTQKIVFLNSEKNMNYERTSPSM